MNKLLAPLDHALPLCRNLFVPALIFAVALIGYCLAGTVSASLQLTCHGAFYVLSFVAFLILLYFNQNKPVFYILITALAYILINFFKNKYGSDFLRQPAYLYLTFFIPLNLIVFYFLPAQRLLRRSNVYWLLIVFAQFALAEKLALHAPELATRLGPTTENGLPTLSLLLFVLFISAAFIRNAFSGSILDYALAFAGLEIACGFYQATSSTALTIFFSSAALTVLLAVAADVYFGIYQDNLTGFSSRNAFISQSKDFPLKYSLGILSVDDYDKLSLMFGRRNRDKLLRMISLKIRDNTAAEDLIYRYNEDEFVIIFKNEDKNEGYNNLESIRRSIAAAAFKLYGRSRPVKITVSGSIAEKKRSDANAFEVLVRAHKVLSKTLSFSHNVTSKA